MATTVDSLLTNALPISGKPLFPFQWSGLKKHDTLSPQHLFLLSKTPLHSLSCIRACVHHNNSHPFPAVRIPILDTPRSSTTAVSAGRSKKKPGGPSPGRIEGNAELRRQAKENARRRSRRLAQNLFYRRNNPSANQADFFTEEELEMIGLGYDRSVRFMSKDDPNLRHPYDWYKYGRYGPYSWRGIVVGSPIRGRFSDERVTLIGEVRDHEEWEQIEQFDMSADFSQRVKALEESRVGLRYYWVFVRHPKWRASELPWQQWTLVCEVAVEASRQQRLDKWSLMGRFGNKTRAMITQCAAWMRPDIIYVKRPVYQCRFEPQDDFFGMLAPLLDPETERRHQFELRDEAGRVETCTYFGGLCRIVKINQKAYVDDVVNAYEKLNDEGKSQCLEFLLTNHPMELLHPYTKDWKAKLEEMELGCDAPDESEDEGSAGGEGEAQITDWLEDDEAEGNDDGYDAVEEEEEENEEIIDVEDDADNEESDTKNEPEDSPEYWEEQWKKAVRSSDAMEKVVKKSIEVSNKFYKKQMMAEQQIKKEGIEGGGLSTMVVDPEQSKEEWETREHRRQRRVKKSKIPPELFLRAAVRPFTYRNLVKEIVLLRHAIIDGDVCAKA